jgi:hypothetical protein
VSSWPAPAATTVLLQGYEKVEQAVVDFEALDQSEEQFRGVDAAFCCLGTTRAVAGKEGFVKVRLVPPGWISPAAGGP